MMTLTGSLLLVSASLFNAPTLAMQAPQAPAGQTAAVASEWPQAVTEDGATFTVNEPSYTAISGNSVTMRAVVTVKRGTAAPTSGTLEMTAVIATSDTPGIVELNEFSITRCDFADGSGETAKAEFTKLLDGIGFDATLSTIVEGIAIDASRDVTGLSNAVPTIKVVETAAVLISVNGKPQFGGCGSSGWQRVVNTPCILLKSPDNAWYARLGGSQWVSAASMNGPFAAATDTPPQDVISAIGKAPNLPESVKSATAANPVTRRGGPSPQVIVATVPTVLISISGKPQMAAVCADVESVTNTADTVLRTAGQWWILGAGRWFSASSLNGPWTFAAASQVPAAFANLPATGRMVGTRASVPGTTEAKAAAVSSNLVRTLTIERNAQCNVKFRGNANFLPIDGTPMTYASNSSQPVVNINGTMYCCDNGAWFMGTNQGGPWSVCDSVPEQIYSIPPSCPIYACTYVEVYGSTSDSVTFGATSGYMGTYMQGGTPVYGTGYDYNGTNPPTVGPDAAAAANVESYLAPAYPATYGNQAEYSPDDGTYAPPSSNDYVDDYPDVYPSVYDDGYGGYGWSPYWGAAYGYGYGGYGYGYGYNDWGRWNRRWGMDRGLGGMGRGIGGIGGIGGVGHGVGGVGGVGRGVGGVGGVGDAGRGVGGAGRGVGGVGGVGGAGRGAGGAGGWGRADGGRNATGMAGGEGRGETGMGGYGREGGNREATGMGGYPRQGGMGNRGSSGFHQAQYRGAGGGGRRGGGGGRR